MDWVAAVPSSKVTRPGSVTVKICQGELVVGVPTVAAPRHLHFSGNLSWTG